MLVLDGF